MIVTVPFRFAGMFAGWRGAGEDGMAVRMRDAVGTGMCGALRLAARDIAHAGAYRLTVHVCRMCGLRNHRAMTAAGMTVATRPRWAGERECEKD